MRVSLKDIVLDKTLYPRSGVSEINVSRLVAAMQTGSILPPVVIDVHSRRLVDGWHRVEAFRRVNSDGSIEAVEKTYPDDAALFADAVRLNVGHGEPLDSHSINNAIIRLEQYGYQRDQISEVVRLPASRIEKIERGFASDESGAPVALKGGLRHLRGETLSEAQLNVNRHYSGGKAIFHVRQLVQVLKNDMWPQTSDFILQMDDLVILWEQIRKRDAA